MYMELEPTEYGIELQKEIQRLIENTQQRKLAPKIAQLITEMMHSMVIDCSNEVIYQNDEQLTTYTVDEYFMAAYGAINDK